MLPIAFERAIGARDSATGRLVTAYYVRYECGAVLHGPHRANTICNVLEAALREARALPDAEPA